MKEKSSLLDEFKSIGKPRETNPEIFEKSIHFDNRQYSFKIPKILMDKVGYKKGDKIRFCLNRPYQGIEDLKIEYVRDDGSTK